MPLGDISVSYYDNESVDPRWGGITKGGEKFDENKLTAAVLPEDWNSLKGKTLELTRGNKTVKVRVNDTGDFKKYGRSLDISKSAFERLGNTSEGVIKVNAKEIK